MFTFVGFSCFLLFIAERWCVLDFWAILVAILIKVEKFVFRSKLTCHAVRMYYFYAKIFSKFAKIFSNTKNLCIGVVYRWSSWCWVSFSVLFNISVIFLNKLSNFVKRVYLYIVFQNVFDSMYFFRLSLGFVVFLF